MVTAELAPVEKLDRELKALGRLFTRDQARGLVDLYYRWQEHRIALHAQIRAALADPDDPNADIGTEVELLTHFADQIETLEKQMFRVFDDWTDHQRVGQWAKNQVGVGPTLSAGLIAHVDITRAQTAGAIWRFAGLDPTVKWEKGQKRPWNADLKVLCWKIGDSFVKTSNHPDSFYGPLYKQRKTYEQERDAAGGNTETAARILKEKTIRNPELRKRLESGHLPDGQLDARARRWTVKLFLSHWHEIAYQDHHRTPPPKPYATTQTKHVHYIPPPEG